MSHEPSRQHSRARGNRESGVYAHKSPLHLKRHSIGPQPFGTRVLPRLAGATRRGPLQSCCAYLYGAHDAANHGRGVGALPRRG